MGAALDCEPPPARPLAAARRPAHCPTCPLAALQLIRKKLKKCYKEAGVNYQQECRELAHVRPPA